MLLKNYKAKITVYHSFDIEAANEEEAREEAKEVIWDDHIKDVIIDVEETEDAS